MRGKMAVVRIAHALFVLSAVLMGADAAAQQVRTADPSAGAKQLPAHGMTFARGNRGISAAEQGRQGLRITPRLDTVLTWTDNATSTPQKHMDWLLEVSPGVSVSSERGRFIGMFEARLRNVGYARHDELSEIFGTLRGAGALEAVKDMFFIDLDADVNRNNSMQFGGRSADDDLSVDRDDEVRRWSIGPRLHFRLGGAAEGSIRYRSTWLDGNDHTYYGRQHEQLWNGQLGDASASRYLGWNLEYTDIRTDYDATGAESGRKLGRATVYVNLARQFRLRLTGGHESYDGAATDDKAVIGGGGFDWTPTPRTTISALAEKRVFGAGYNISIRHRMRHVLLEAGGIRDISTLSDSSVYMNPAFMALFNDPGWIAQFPDPRQRADQLAAILPEGTTNAFYRDQTWHAGVSYIGLRNTVTLVGQRSRRRTLMTGSVAGYGFYGQTRHLDSDTATLAFSHRLTPLATLDAMVSHARAKGDNDLDTRRTMASLGMNTRLGLQTRGGVMYRFQRSDSDAQAYDFTENLVRANLGVTF